MRTRKVLQRRAFSQAVAKRSPSRFLLPHPPSPRRYPHQQAPEGGISRGRSAVIGFQTDLKSKVAAAAAARAHSPFLGMRARLSVRGEPELPPPPSPSLAASGALAPARRAGRKERGKEAEKKAGGRARTPAASGVESVLRLRAGWWKRSAQRWKGAETPAAVARADGSLVLTSRRWD